MGMTRWRIALWSAGAFAALAVLVHLGLLNNLDTIVRDWARPHDVWGTAQLRADFVVEGLRPMIMAVLLVTFTLAYCAKRRSLTPVAFVGTVGALTVALTVGSKMIVGRLDPHGVIGANGGSFPSGHVIGVVVSVGIVIMVLQPRTGRWIWLIPAAGGVLMGTCLLLQAAHWFIDILGGALLATAVLAAVSALIDWLPNRSGNDHESAVPEQRNGPSLTRVGERPTWIARLSNAVPDIGLADCYHPGREKFVLRSCGGL
jgi:membrane-associated phospholipid phosphatase